jgi:hypothetical protein
MQRSKLKERTVGHKEAKTWCRRLAANPIVSDNLLTKVCTLVSGKYSKKDRII